MGHCFILNVEIDCFSTHMKERVYVITSVRPSVWSAGRVQNHNVQIFLDMSNVFGVHFTWWY